MPAPSERLSLIYWGAALLAFLAAVCWTFWPALTGPFIFDDFSNLSRLEWINGDITLESLRRLLMESNAGPSGRPLSVLSFLLNDFDWPSHPESFKYTNLMIHCINSLLLMWLIKLVLDIVTPRDGTANAWIALLMVAFWAMNPYQMSSVMYVVQRMALMATTFVVAGLVMYIKGRQAMQAGSLTRGLALVWGGYLLACLVGGLSKENAVLFVLLVPLFEFAVFRNPANGRPFLLRLTLFVPVLMFAAMLAYLWPGQHEQYLYLRDFSLSERLLSEGRALGYYLWRYLVPGVSYVGIFADGFEKSTGWLAPASTLLWWLIHALILVLALIGRRRWPLLFLSVTFFYVGHSLESSYLPLELFFEHRNYLPSMLLLLGLAHVTNVRMLAAGLFVLVLLCVPLNRVQAGFWAKEHDLFVIMMSENPKSERAIQVFAAYVDTHFGKEAAMEILEPAASTGEVGPEFAMSWLLTRCRLGMDTREDVDLLLKSVENKRLKPPFLVNRSWLFASAISGGQCASLTFEDYKAFIDKVFDYRPHNSLSRQSYYLSHGVVALTSGDYEKYKEFMYKALDTPPENVDLALGVCGELAKMGDTREACGCYQKYQPGEGRIVDVERNKFRSMLGRDELLRRGFEEGIVNTCDRPGTEQDEQQDQ